jgi:hypothetical protein
MNALRIASAHGKADLGGFPPVESSNLTAGHRGAGLRFGGFQSLSDHSHRHTGVIPGTLPDRKQRLC